MSYVTTRQALWNESNIHMCKAQDLDREVRQLRADLELKIAHATEHRRVAHELGVAAEVLGKLDIK
jgi:hypothetical protein